MRKIIDYYTLLHLNNKDNIEILSSTLDQLEVAYVIAEKKYKTPFIKKRIERIREARYILIDSKRKKQYDTDLAAYKKDFEENLEKEVEIFQKEIYYNIVGDYYKYPDIYSIFGLNEHLPRVILLENVTKIKRSTIEKTNSFKDQDYTYAIDIAESALKNDESKERYDILIEEKRKREAIVSEKISSFKERKRKEENIDIDLDENSPEYQRADLLDTLNNTPRSELTYRRSLFDQLMRLSLVTRGDPEIWVASIDDHCSSAAKFRYWAQESLNDNKKNDSIKAEKLELAQAIAETKEVLALDSRKTTHQQITNAFIKYAESIKYKSSNGPNYFNSAHDLHEYLQFLHSIYKICPTENLSKHLTKSKRLKWPWVSSWTLRVFIVGLLFFISIIYIDDTWEGRLLALFIWMSFTIMNIAPRWQQQRYITVHKFRGIFEIFHVATKLIFYAILLAIFKTIA